MDLLTASTARTGNVLHLLSSLEIGGKERAALRLARRGLAEGQHHSLFLFDAPYRGTPSELAPQGVEWMYFPRRPGIDLRLSRSVARAVARLSVETIHAHNETSIFYAVLARAFHLGARRPRIVGTFHTRPTYPKRITRLIARLAFRQPEAFAAVSEELRDWLLTSGLIGSCDAIVNGVEPAALVQARRAADNPVRFIAVSRFDPIKRHVDLIDAFAALAARHPRVTLHLYGGGPCEPEIRRRAAPLAGRVVLHGVTQDVARALSEADVFVQCSDDEGTPLALLEAMAAGLPCVCTAVGGMPALVGGSEGIDGCAVLVAPRDIQALSAAMSRLAEDAPLRQRLGANALKHAAARSFESEWLAYRRLYAGGCATRR